VFYFYSDEKGMAGMKAFLYAVRIPSGWMPGVSVAWEVDRLFWTQPAFRAGAVSGWGGKHEMGGDPAEIAWVKESLPLGIAGAAAESLKASLNIGAGSGYREKLRQAVWDAAVGAGEDETSVAGNPETEYLTIGRAAEHANHGSLHEQGRAMAGHARYVAERLKGRSLLQGEAAVMLAPSSPDHDAAALVPSLQLAALLGGLRLLSGVAPDETASGLLARRKNGRSRFRCRRCGSGETQLHRTSCASCGRMCAYCEACLTMGRSRECGLLIVGMPSRSSTAAFPIDAQAAHPDRRWTLSPAQREAAASALSFLMRPQAPPGKASMLQAIRQQLSRMLPRLAPAAHPRVFLMWAVTGAGKTEMMFPLLEAVLAAGGKAAVATPRRDVVLELAPRLASAFPGVRQTVLYGGSPDRFEPGDLTLATTHQLIRFRQAFDLVVIDEVDAYPYHNDPTLHYAAQQARSEGGSTILLSATPPPAMQRDARRGRLPHARVPVRHHRHPLPVPRRLAMTTLTQWTNASRQRIPAVLRRKIRDSLARGAQLFLFVPFIHQVVPLVQCLRAEADLLGIAHTAIEGTFSQDPQRMLKVTGFRERNLRILVTTTILERGVTIPKSDVFVLDADKPLFDSSSLVQMAGRAGRSADDPHGFVYFAAFRWTVSQRNACRQIKDMNAIARKHGYLRG
jgi:competence protein ComFA